MPECLIIDHISNGHMTMKCASWMDRVPHSPCAAKCICILRLWKELNLALGGMIGTKHKLGHISNLRGRGRLVRKGLPILDSYLPVGAKLHHPHLWLYTNSLIQLHSCSEERWRTRYHLQVEWEMLVMHGCIGLKAYASIVIHIWYEKIPTV